MRPINCRPISTASARRLCGTCQIEAGNGATGRNGEVEKLFAQLASRSLIVDNPTRPHEFYSNARLREIRGDYPKARQDYLKYFAFGMPQVDPHLRFQAVLKIQEGREGAREVYRALSQGRQDPTTLFAEILLAEREERVRRLTAFHCKSGVHAGAIRAVAGLQRGPARPAVDDRQETRARASHPLHGGRRGRTFPEVLSGPADGRGADRGRQDTPLPRFPSSTPPRLPIR
ncbi:MAG: hypothetical protein HPM95_06280 [Alphaproteobacteria bacterium]|nr:hypothetical protein [Alphaproteobacteria bacterium]